MTRHLIKRIALLVFTSFAIMSTQAQIGIGVNPPDPSAVLHIQDTARGLLIPRMTAVQRTGIVSPAEGLLVYQTNSATGFWYFSGGQWRNMSLANNGGKQTLVLSDNITNIEAVAKIAAEVGPNTQEVRILRCSNLTTVDLSMITSLTEVYISGNSVLQSVNLNNLQVIDGGLFIDQCPLLASVSTPSLKRIGQTFNGTYGLQVTKAGITNLSFPLLDQVTGSINITQNTALLSISFAQMTSHTSSATVAFTIQANAALTSFSAPLLVNVRDFFIGNNNNITSVNLPLLTTVNSLTIASANLLTSLSFPALSTISNCMILGAMNTLTTLSLPILSTAGCLNIQGLNAMISISFPSLTSINQTTNGSYIYYNTNLSSVNLNSLTNFTGAGFGFNGNKLPSSQVNTLLNKFVSITPAIVNKTFDFRQSIPAPPTGQGISDKVTLIARPNTVDTD